ncbi:TonB-dependent receptor plug domain-containing protein [Bacteroidia bacterium]|nr:TonB-dependent receptor plug domain-containing protein [Bacteroidia bacterium]
MVKGLFLQAVFLVLVTRCAAQVMVNYQGIITDASNEVIIGAQFMHPESGKIMAVSDEEGKYNFEANTMTIVVSQIGFKNGLLKKGKSKIVLYEETSLLGAVVVTENKRETQLKNATISMEIIPPHLITNTAPTNMEESIGRINGVQVVDNQPNIRSGSGWSYGAGSRVQVLVDGVPLLSGDAGQPLWTFVPTEGIEGVEILKGASSVIYGSSALNGVINIKTRKSNKPFTQISASTGFYDLPKSSIGREGVFME